MFFIAEPAFLASHAARGTGVTPTLPPTLDIFWFLAKKRLMSRPFSAENVFRALGHRTRRRIVESLRKKNRFAGDLLDVSNLSAGTLSEHLRILRSAGLVTCKRRGTRLEYQLSMSALREAAAWLATFETRKHND